MKGGCPLTEVKVSAAGFDEHLLVANVGLRINASFQSQAPQILCLRLQQHEQGLDHHDKALGPLELLQDAGDELETAALSGSSRKNNDGVLLLHRSHSGFKLTKAKVIDAKDLLRHLPAGNGHWTWIVFHFRRKENGKRIQKEFKKLWARKKKTTLIPEKEINVTFFSFVEKQNKTVFLRAIASLHPSPSIPLPTKSICCRTFLPPFPDLSAKNPTSSGAVSREFAPAQKFVLNPKKKIFFLFFFSRCFLCWRQQPCQPAMSVRKKRKVTADTAASVDWKAVEAVIHQEMTLLSDELGSLSPTASVADFELQNIITMMQQKAPHLWNLFANILEKNEGQKIKNNDRRDILLAFVFSAALKFMNQRANRLSVFFGLFLLSKGTPVTVEISFSPFVAFCYWC